MRKGFPGSWGGGSYDSERLWNAVAVGSRAAALGGITWLCAVALIIFMIRTPISCKRDVISVSTSPDWHISSNDRIQMLKYDFRSHLFHSFDYDFSSILNLPMKWVEKLGLCLWCWTRTGGSGRCVIYGLWVLSWDSERSYQSKHVHLCPQGGKDETHLLSHSMASGWWWHLHLNCVLRVWQSRA